VNVLMVTPGLDDENPKVGFARTWVTQLATRVERLHVIPVMGGDSPAANVQVHSLGREHGLGKLRRLENLYRAVGTILRQDRPDVIFVHMLPLYVVLLAPLAWAYRVPLVLWFAYGRVDATLRLAHRLVQRVVTASPESFRLEDGKTVVLGHGIDTARFCAGVAGSTPHVEILAVNRIAPDKDLETLLRAVALSGASCRIVGATDERHREYRDHLDALVGELGIGKRTHFAGPLPYQAMVEQYRACTLFVSTSLTGSVDKVVLEAMACERPILTCNESFGGVLGVDGTALVFPHGDFQGLAVRIDQLLWMDAESRAGLGRELRAIVVRDHDLAGFMERLVALFVHVGGVA
jgi:glycosyltransferase involved in cell wall biosynthesis